MAKKFSGVEIQLASSILYYDEEEMQKFFIIYDKLAQDKDIVIDGMFNTFVKYLRKFNNFDNDPEVRRNNIIIYIQNCNEHNPNKNSRETFSLWFDQVVITETKMEFAEDIRDRFLWESFKRKVELIDSSDIPFKEKLLIKPQTFINSSDDEIVKLSSIELEEDIVEQYSTGLEELDRIVKINATNFVVVAARPGVGKSLFMIQSAIANARKGKKVLFSSFEMNKKQIHKRIINNFAGRDIEEEYIDSFGQLKFNEYKEEVNKIMAHRAFKVIDQNLDLFVTPEKSAYLILDKIEKRVKKDKYDIVFIDYLQLLKYPQLDEWASLRELTTQLKNLAFRLNIAVVTASQVSRSSVERGLSLVDLFGSSTIEADTDIVLGLENPRDRRQGEKAILNIKILKNRDGSLGEIKSLVDYATGRIIIQ